MLGDRRGKIPVVFLRIAGVYDDDGRSPFLAEQIARIYEHRLTSHFYPGMLCAAQSFVHRADLADAVARLVDRRNELPAEIPLLIGEPEALGYGEIHDIVGHQLHGEGWATLRIPQPIAKAGVILQNEVLGSDQFIQPWMVDNSNDHYILDVSRARTLLGWEPKHRLRDTLPAMVAALKRDPEGWYAANKLNANLVAWYVKRDRQQGAPPGEPAEERGMGAARGTEHRDHARNMATDEGHGGHMARMERDERRTRWAHYANFGLGMWLAARPFH